MSRPHNERIAICIHRLPTQQLCQSIHQIPGPNLHDVSHWVSRSTKSKHINWLTVPSGFQTRMANRKDWIGISCSTLLFATPIAKGSYSRFWNSWDLPRANRIGKQYEPAKKRRLSSSMFSSGKLQHPFLTLFAYCRCGCTLKAKSMKSALMFRTENPRVLPDVRMLKSLWKTFCMD